MDPNRKRDMTGFYRDLLDKSTRSGPILLGDQKMAQKMAHEHEIDDSKMAQKMALEHEIDEAKMTALEEKSPATNSKNIVLNDNQEVVDKRQLLSGGLNISSKAMKRKQVQDEEEERKKEKERRDKQERLRQEQKRYHELQEQKARNTAMIMSQKAKIDEEKEKASSMQKKQVLDELTKSTVSSASVLDAKARYLARKAAMNDAN